MLLTMQLMVKQHERPRTATILWNDDAAGTLTSAEQQRGRALRRAVRTASPTAIRALPPMHDDRANVEAAASGVTGRNEAKVLWTSAKNCSPECPRKHDTCRGPVLPT